jgi:transposase-like protein
MPKCPHCHTETLTKAGLNRSGSQRYRCKACRRYATPAPKVNGYPIEVHEQALKYYLEGIGLRRIGRFLGVAHQTVINWINAAHARLPQPVPQPVRSAVTELDELYTFVHDKKTKCMWLQPWIARLAV